MFKDYRSAIDFLAGPLLAILVWLLSKGYDINLRIYLCIFIVVIPLIYALIRLSARYKNILNEERLNYKKLQLDFDNLNKKLSEKNETLNYWIKTSNKHALYLEQYKTKWHYLGIVIAATRPNVNKDKLDYIFNLQQQFTAELIEREGKEDEQ